MKSKTRRMVLSLFFALGLVFLFSIVASGSHGDGTGITAAEVEPTSQSDMENFVQHIADYYNGIRDRFDPVTQRAELIRELTIFARDIRRESGDYRHGEVYAIGVTDNLVITNHARYPELIGYKVDTDAGTPLADTFKALLGNSAIGTKNCENYGQNKVACAAKVESDFTVDVTNIAGLHHEIDLDNLDAAFVPPDCTGLTIETTAEEVFNDPSDANLEAYVKDVIEAVQRDTAKITVEEIGKLADLDDLASLAKLLDPAVLTEILDNTTTRIQERLFCFGSGDFKHENIYVFVMGADLENSTVLVNGNNFDLNGANLELEDDLLSGEQNIARLFDNALGGGADGNNTYVDYHWDDPTDPDDNVPNFFEDRKVPGTSPKRSYIEVANLNGQLFEAIADASSALDLAAITGFLATSTSPAFAPQLYIFGSGTYPEQDDMMDDMTDEDDIVDEIVDAASDGGCTIAGTSNTSQGTLLNLFLIAAVLFSVVFLRRRV